MNKLKEEIKKENRNDAHHKWNSTDCVFNFESNYRGNSLFYVKYTDSDEGETVEWDGLGQSTYTPVKMYIMINPLPTILHNCG